MSVKSKGRRLGKAIRRATGLPLPEAMGIAKLVVRERQYDALAKFPDTVKRTETTCSDGCCYTPEYVITGPKGNIVTDYSMSYTSVLREVRTMDIFKKNPGAVVTPDMVEVR